MRIYLSIIFVGLHLIMSAQKREVVSADPVRVKGDTTGLDHRFTESDTFPSSPKHTIKFALWPLLNTARTAFDIGSDYRVGDNWTIDLELGYYFSSATYANHPDESYTGWRVRPGFKYSVGGVQLGLLYKYENATNEFYETLVRQGGAYLEEYLVPRKIIKHGIQFRAEAPLKLDKKGRFIVEPFIRLGVQAINVSYDLPSDAQVNIGLVDDVDPFRYGLGQQIRGDLYIGFNIGLAWW